MTDFTPTPEAVEAAANAIKDQWLSEGPHWLPKDCARAAIAAFVEAEGLTVQTVDPGRLIKEWVGNGEVGAQRLVGSWRKRD